MKMSANSIHIDLATDGGVRVSHQQLRSHGDRLATGISEKQVGWFHVKNRLYSELKMYEFN